MYPSLHVSAWTSAESVSGFELLCLLVCFDDVL